MFNYLFHPKFNRIIKKSNLWYYIKNYRFNSVFIKNFLLIISLIVLPLAGMSIAVYYNYNNIMKNEISTSSTLALSRVNDMVDLMFRISNNLTDLVELDQQVQLFMLTNKSMQLKDDDGLYEPASIIKTLATFVRTSDYIDSIYIYSEMNNFVITSRENSTMSELKDRSWYDKYLEEKDNSDRFSMARTGMLGSSQISKYVLTTVKPFRMYKNKSLGAIIVNIDMAKLRRVIEKTSGKQFVDFFIVDDNGLILYNNNFTKIDTNIRNNSSIKDILSSQDNYSVVKGTGASKQIISYVTSDYCHWRLASIMPLEYYEHQISNLKSFMIGFISFSILIAVIVAFFISLKVFNPIKNIISVIDNKDALAEMDNINEHKNINEIMYIKRNIADTISKSKKMEQELAHRLILLKNAQAAALQSQINPHFLYNTLGTINWMAIGLTKCDNEVSAMISSLSELLRLSLESSNNLITIRTELEHAQRYVEIQEVRYKNKFDVVWNIDHTILDNLIVKITLQPIIENAIYHGIKPKTGKGTIEIKGCIEDDNIVFEIIDDGVGMQPERVNMINMYLNEEYEEANNEHIGMKNVNQRIRLIFGEQFGVTVKSESDRGTVIKIVLPTVK